MKKTWLLSFFIVIALFIGRPQEVLAAEGLNKIVSPSLLGATLKYAEYVIGIPAKWEKKDKFGFQRNTYIYQGCYIELGAKDGQVASIGMRFSPENGCDLDVRDIVQSGPQESMSKVMGSKTTFNDYAWRGELHFTDPQLPSCNACWEGDFYATIDGYGALDNYLSVQLLTDASGPRNAWRDLVVDGLGYEGIDNLPLTAMNCPLRQFDTKAFDLLKSMKVTGIAFSRMSGSLQPECSGKAVHDLILRLP